MMHIDNVSAGYLDKEILKSISCKINEKDFFGVIGKNGVGKSTLLKVLCKLIKPYSGDVFVNCKNINYFSRREFAKMIAFLPQHVDTSSLSFSVFEFIAFGRYPYMNIFKIPSGKDYVVIKRIMDFLQITNLAQRKINELSGGEKQKILIAQVLAQETDIIVFDEPTSHLDIGSQNDILGILRDLNENYNKIIILTLHDLNVASEFCNKLVLLENGSICKYGTPEEVLNCVDIERVYNTEVIVKINPISHKPYVLSLSKKVEER
ncbi:MAG: ABC transporter ATP-binding protein [Endomicrobium sp.]|jgi:iron complex transport system ATP-binding protein|nr:ABC transporter ATP-binding protein [Endomicrobium sp.]